jgi:fumarate hydratase subunit alpha
LPITHQAVKSLTAQLYDWSLRKVPDDTKSALEAAAAAESSDGAREVLTMMRNSAEIAETRQGYVCSDAGVPVYFIRVGAGARFEGDVAGAISDGFDELVERIEPPLLKHVTNPLTLERGYRGKDMPLVTWEISGTDDCIDITCAPKALGTGPWAALEVFTFPPLDVIENYVLDCVIRAGSQHCPPVVVGVGIGGSFDHAAKLAKMATLRPIGTTNQEPILEAMEARLLKAVNATGFGPMGTGGDTTALAVHVDYSSGHGFTPVAVCFNCWINRRTRAKLFNDGRIERLE